MDKQPMTVYSKPSTVNHSAMLCNANHVWIHTNGGTNGKIPGGTPCQCGRMVAHYTICDECGAQKFEAIDTHREGKEDV
jgi:hypothetical protein